MFHEIKEILQRAAGIHGSYHYRKGIFLLKGKTVNPMKILPGARIVKKSGSVTAGVSGNFFVKQYLKKDLWKGLKRTIQLPRSNRSMAAALRLQEAGLLTPQVIFASRYCLVTEALPPDVSFLGTRRDLASGFLPVLAKMHEGGIYHGDLSLRNIYCSKKGEYGVIDLDGSFLYTGPVPVPKRILDMARFISSLIFLSHEKNIKELIRSCTESYQNSCGIDLRGKKLNRRILYLLKHTRKA